MKRLTIGISKDSNLQLSCSAYFALTRNALMFGARADLYAAASGAVMRGYLSFDALVHFSPFSFEIQIGAGVDVSYEGVDLTSVDLYFVLAGPTPWVARGSAEFEVLYVSVSVDFTFTWGDANKATLPAVDPWEKLPETPGLLDALELPESWLGSHLSIDNRARPL